LFEINISVGISIFCKKGQSFEESTSKTPFGNVFLIHFQKIAKGLSFNVLLSLTYNPKNMNEKNGKKLDKIKEKLIEKKKAIISQLQKFSKKNKNIKDSYTTNFPNIGDHTDENADEVSDYESSRSVGRDLESELKNIEGALKKTSEKTYGTCSSCGETINPKRLEVVPEATMCIKCSEKKR